MCVGVGVSVYILWCSWVLGVYTVVFEVFHWLRG